MAASRKAALAPALVAALLTSGGCAERERVAEPAASRAPVETRSSVDRAVATTGDLITYRVTVDHDEDYEVEVPEPGADIAGFRIVDLGREAPRRADGRVVEERWYTLRADLVGSYVLPPVAVAFRPRQEPVEPAAAPDGPGDEASAPGAASDEPAPGDRAGDAPDAGRWQVAETSAIFVEVASVLGAEGEAEDIRDLKPLRRLRRPVPWAWIAGGAGLLALAGAALLFYRRRRRAPEAPAVPPHERAFAALDALRRTDFDDPEAVRRFHFTISEVVREYVEGRFGLNATDLTTEEILARLDELETPPPPLPGPRPLETATASGEGAAPPPALGAGERDELARFLLDTDRVKFADHVPAKSDIEATYERALGFVERTRPLEEPAPPAEEAA